VLVSNAELRRRSAACDHARAIARNAGRCCSSGIRQRLSAAELGSSVVVSSAADGAAHRAK
jgi:hypothetical protein